MNRRSILLKVIFEAGSPLQRLEYKHYDQSRDEGNCTYHDEKHVFGNDFPIVTKKAGRIVSHE